MKDILEGRGVMSDMFLFHPAEDVFIDSRRADENFNHYIYDWIGKKNCETTYRTLMRFDGCIPKDGIVKKAILKLYVDEADNPDNLCRVTPYLITTPWKADQVTWNTCPSFDSDIHGSTAIVGGKGWYEWDITGLVKLWVAKVKNNYGILIKGCENQMFGSKRIVGGKNTKQWKAELRPVLMVCYETDDKKNVAAKLNGRRFIEKSATVHTTDEPMPTQCFDTSQQSQATLFVMNMGHNPAIITYQVSPDELNFTETSMIYEVLPGKTIAVVPMIFGKYTRLVCQSEYAGQHTLLKAVFQSHV